MPKIGFPGDEKVPNDFFGQLIWPLHLVFPKLLPQAHVSPVPLRVYRWWVFSTVQACRQLLSALTNPWRVLSRK